MKKFVLTVLCVSVFFFGLGGLIQQVGAKFKSDQRALEILRQARTAIGGEDAIHNVRSLSIVGKQSLTFDLNGAPRTAQGDVEINLQLPNQFIKMVKLQIGDKNAEGSSQTIEQKEVNVVMLKKGDGGNVEFKTENSNSPNGTSGGNARIIIKKGDGELKELSAEDGKRIVIDKDVRVGGVAAGEHHQNELLRTTLGLLLSAPEGSDVSFTFAGEGSVDGTTCNIINAQSGNDNIKLFIAQGSNLPLMMSYQGVKMPRIINLDKMPKPNDGDEKDVKVFVRQAETAETAEFQVKFSDYRNVNGVLLPYRWTQTVGGKDDGTVEISSYEVNPANIAEKFNKMPGKVTIQMKKPE